MRLSHARKNLPLEVRRTRYGYRVGVPVVPVVPLGRAPGYLTAISCAPPLSHDGTRLQVSSAWATACFMPAYHQAHLRWGVNDSAITAELVHELVPNARLHTAASGAEHQLRQRIALAVAVLQNQAGIPTAYPPAAPTPRPRVRSLRPAWLRALLTGWT